MTDTLKTRIIEQCDRCKKPVRRTPPAYRHGPGGWEHTGEPCTRTYGTNPQPFPVDRPEPIRVCDDDGGELADSSDAWSDGSRCTVCGKSWRHSLGD